jgi:hypothetical protein
VKQQILVGLSGWRDQRFVVASSMSVDDARRRLSEDLASRRVAVQYAGEHDLGGADVVVGRLRGPHLTVTVTQPGVRNSWRPILRGRLDAARSGSQLVCRVGWHPLTRALSFIWLAVAAFGLAINLVRAGGNLLSGQVVSAAHPATVAAVCLGMGLFLSAVATAATWQARNVAACLRAWATDRLQVQA